MVSIHFKNGIIREWKRVVGNEKEIGEKKNTQEMGWKIKLKNIPKQDKYPQKIKNSETTTHV